MRRKHLSLIVALSLIATLMAGLSWSIYIPVRQDRLNRGLIVAIKQNDTKQVLALLAEGADPNSRDEPSQHLSLWRLLLDRLRGRHPSDEEVPTALILAAQGPYENLPIVNALLDHGADANVHYYQGVTPLIFAAEDDEELTRCLLDHGADANRQDDFGGTALTMAAVWGNPKIVGLLLRHGANVNLKTKKGKTALMYAKGRPEIIRLLKQAGAKE